MHHNFNKLIDFIFKLIAQKKKGLHNDLFGCFIKLISVAYDSGTGNY